VLQTAEIAVDLGSGGGVPGLILALGHDTSWVLLEASQKRCMFLEEAIADLGLQARVSVRRARAEECARSGLRGAVDAVVARGFGPPAVTAECGAPLLRVGGTLWVADPPRPDRQMRWPEAGLATLGLARRDRCVEGWTGLDQRLPCPQRYPRRAGIPAKRPLF